MLGKPLYACREAGLAGDVAHSFVLMFGELPRDKSCPMECDSRTILRPARSIPAKPSLVRMTVSKVGAMFPYKLPRRPVLSDDIVLPPDIVESDLEGGAFHEIPYQVQAFSAE